MPSVEERVATLEGRVQEQAAFMADVRSSTAEPIRELRREMERLFAQLDQRFEQVDKHFGQIDLRFDRIDGRFEKLERYVLWSLGVMMTGFTAMLAALLGDALRS